MPVISMLEISAVSVSTALIFFSGFFFIFLFCLSYFFYFVFALNSDLRKDHVLLLNFLALQVMYFGFKKVFARVCVSVCVHTCAIVESYCFSCLLPRLLICLHRVCLPQAHHSVCFVCFSRLAALPSARSHSSLRASFRARRVSVM